jgi:putative membrane protein
MKPQVLLAVSLFVLAVSGAAQAAQPGDDSAFIKEAIKGDNSEIMLGRVAQQHGASASMRAFGAMLVTDHTKGRDQATVVARGMGVAPPSGPMAEADVERAKLAVMSGPAFDREFAKYMVNDHQHDIADFETEAAHGHGEAAILARKTLPVLRKHLAAAERLAGPD